MLRFIIKARSNINTVLLANQIYQFYGYGYFFKFVKIEKKLGIKEK